MTLIKRMTPPTITAVTSDIDVVPSAGEFSDPVSSGVAVMTKRTDI